MRRLQNKKVDPETGKFYNLEVCPPSDENTLARLVTQTQDNEENVIKVYKRWK